jgi:hypothetical protein
VIRYKRKERKEMSRGITQITIPVVFRDDEIEVHDMLVQSIGNRSFTKWVKEREIEYLNKLAEENNEHLNDTENE